MRIFISYARVDMPRVREIVDMLSAAGHEPWFDNRLLPGQDWQAELLRAVQACDAFLYALTPESVASEWCQWEFSEAVKLGKPVIPVLLQAKTQVPPAISRYQYVNFSDGMIPLEVARLMGGLHIAVVIPVSEAPPAPAQPAGVPAQAAAATGSPRPEGAGPGVRPILPPPFEWVDIPAGQVTIEYDSSNHKTFTVPKFAIAKYPVTNAQFQVFVDADDGYRDPRWWDYSGDAEAWRAESDQPEAPAFKGVRDHPRANVTWYEAVAFCRWLSERTGETITLLTEQQWQRAAQGDDGRKYPWGNEFESGRCNSNSSGTTSVLQYPSGASPFGVWDMSGNVSEWCLTTYEGDNNSVIGSLSRVLRGGSWNYVGTDFFRCASRYWDFPLNGFSVWGFRLALS